MESAVFYCQRFLCVIIFLFFRKQQKRQMLPVVSSLLLIPQCSMTLDFFFCLDLLSKMCYIETETKEVERCVIYMVLNLNILILIQSK